MPSESSAPLSVSKRPFPTSQSYRGPGARSGRECIKEAVPDQPERLSACPLPRRRVYQRGRSRPARAPLPDRQQLLRSVSKRPFPTSQSRRARAGENRNECIKEAVPDQPERTGEATNGAVGVYQRGRSRPARAPAARLPPGRWSVSKRPFPTSQSTFFIPPRTIIECIKEAVPDQPEHARPNETAHRASVSKRPFPTSQSGKQRI